MLPTERMTSQTDAPAIETRRHQALVQVMAFLNEIGIPAVFGEVHKDSFLREVAVVHGGLVVTHHAKPSAVLHEAGHLALIPGQHRHKAHGDLDAVIADVLDEEWDDPCCAGAVAAIQCGDPEATAWAWAVGMALGLESREIIMDSEYSSTGRSIRTQLSARAYVGINGLAAARLCVVKSPELAKVSGLPIYPELARWVQPAFQNPRDLARPAPA